MGRGKKTFFGEGEERRENEFVYKGRK